MSVDHNVGFAKDGDFLLTADTFLRSEERVKASHRFAIYLTVLLWQTTLSLVSGTKYLYGFLDFCTNLFISGFCSFQEMP